MNDQNPKPEETTETEQKFVEAAGTTVDPDEDQWRRLSGDSNRDLSPMTQRRMQKLAHYAWESNLLGNRMIEVPIAYLLAEGVKLKASDEEAQAVLDKHWKDPINCWDIKLPKRLRELKLFGEQCWPAFTGGDGHVRLGYLDPALIETVVMDPHNREQPIGVVSTKDRKGQARRYRVIINGPETVFHRSTQAIRETFTDGDCFFFKKNDLCNSTRGRSDLLASIDWLDGYDQFLFGQLDRNELLSAFIWDVTVNGANEEQLEEKAKKVKTPRPGSTRFHNESETWNAVTPGLSADDVAEAARLLRNHVLGGATIPEHWFGGAEDVNRATGESMSEPTLKILMMEQSFLGYMLIEVAKYVLRSKWSVLDDELNDEQQVIIDGVEVEWPEMTAKDVSRYASALQAVVVAISMARSEELMTRELGLRLISAICDKIGVPFDVQQQLTDLADETWDEADDDRMPPATPVKVDDEPETD